MWLRGDLPNTMVNTWRWKKKKKKKKKLTETFGVIMFELIRNHRDNGFLMVWFGLLSSEISWTADKNKLKSGGLIKEEALTATIFKKSDYIFFWFSFGRRITGSHNEIYIYFIFYI